MREKKERLNGDFFPSASHLSYYSNHHRLAWEVASFADAALIPSSLFSTHDSEWDLCTERRQVRKAALVKLYVVQVSVPVMPKKSLHIEGFRPVPATATK